MNDADFFAGLVSEIAERAKEHRLRAELLGIPIVFTAGRRTWQEQLVEYEKGRERTSAGWIVVEPALVVTHALPEQAPHVRGGAYDLVPIIHERAAWDRLDLFAELGRLGRSLGLVWGGDWKMRDMPHFELPRWRELPMPTT